MNLSTKKTSPTSIAPMTRRHLPVLPETAGHLLPPEMRIAVAAAVAVVDADRVVAEDRAVAEAQAADVNL
jgi:hypothetical protein